MTATEPAAPFGSATGAVASFDDHRGYGTVGDRAGNTWFFHCTAIADGTRTIATGAEVTFTVVAGRRGHWEAADLRPARPTGQNES